VQVGLDHEQLAHVQPQLTQRRRRDGRWRVEQHHQPASLLHRSQAGRQQADLADAGMRQQQLRDRASRPTAARQLGIEYFEPTGDGPLGAAAELVGPPELGVQLLGRQHRPNPGGRPRGEGRIDDEGLGGVHGDTVWTYSYLRKSSDNF
jgi:hypothetical protein